VGKVQFSEIQKPRDLDLDLGSGHTAYRHASLIDLYLHTNFIEIGNIFADGRTDISPSNVIRSTRRSQPKNEILGTPLVKQCD